MFKKVLTKEEFMQLYKADKIKKEKDREEGRRQADKLLLETKFRNSISKIRMKRRYY